MIINTNICEVITIMCDINIINMTFYLLLHAKKKKSVYYKIIQKIEGEHFIKSNYFKYFIPNNLKKKYLRVGMCPSWPYTGSAHAHMGFHSTHDIYDLPKMESRQVINQKLLVIGS